MRYRVLPGIMAAVATTLAVFMPASAQAQAGARLEPISYEPMACGPNCTTLRIYYNQAPPAGEGWGLANFSGLNWSGRPARAIFTTPMLTTHGATPTTRALISSSCRMAIPSHRLSRSTSR